MWDLTELSKLRQQPWKANIIYFPRCGHRTVISGPTPWLLLGLPQKVEVATHTDLCSPSRAAIRDSCVLLIILLGYLFPFRCVFLVGWFALKQEEMTVELYCSFSKRRDDEMMRTNRRLMMTWFIQSWCCLALPATQGLDWGRRGSGMTEMLWWNSLSQWPLSLGLVLDDCSSIVWNLTDRTDDAASPCCDCLEDIKGINVGVAAYSRVVSWVSAQPVVTHQGSGKSAWCSGLHWWGKQSSQCYVTWPNPSPSILCASLELVCHGRGYLGHLWDSFLNVGTFLRGIVT